MRNLRYAQVEQLKSNELILILKSIVYLCCREHGVSLWN